ncbi:hypothetical protein AHF37_07308 [Paragonimus kellicotti]|nr:hypothetical protein AHF37_07308 [Paragonimus kellicotti]
MPEYLSLRQGWLSCATRKVINRNPIESEVDIELDSDQLEEQELDVNCGTFEILMNYLVKKWTPRTDQFQFSEISILTDLRLTQSQYTLPLYMVVVQNSRTDTGRHHSTLPTWITYQNR